jgi:hypothetical protein
MALLPLLPASPSSQNQARIVVLVRMSPLVRVYFSSQLMLLCCHCSSSFLVVVNWPLSLGSQGLQLGFLLHLGLSFRFCRLHQNSGLLLWLCVSVRFQFHRIPSSFHTRVCMGFVEAGIPICLERHCCLSCLLK